MCPNIYTKFSILVYISPQNLGNPVNSKPSLDATENTIETHGNTFSRTDRGCWSVDEDLGNFLLSNFKFSTRVHNRIHNSTYYSNGNDSVIAVLKSRKTLKKCSWYAIVRNFFCPRKRTFPGRQSTVPLGERKLRILELLLSKSKMH